MKTKPLIFTVFLTLIFSFQASASTLQHAEFGFDGSDIAKALRLASANVSQSPVTVYCQAVISAIGAIEGAACFNKKGQRALADQVSEAVSNQSFWPAHVNGKAIAVRANFRVVLQSDLAQGLSVRVLPNLGTLQSQYGQHYVEPQERLDLHGWYDYFVARQTAASVPFFSHNDDMVRVAGTVKLNGDVAQADVLQADKGLAREAKWVKSGLRNAKFIPGYVDGQPLPMSYLAVVTFE